MIFRYIYNNTHEQTHVLTIQDNKLDSKYMALLICIIVNVSKNHPALVLYVYNVRLSGIPSSCKWNLPTL